MYRLIGLLLIMITFTANSQELNCKVQINFDRITDANPQIFKTLERSLTDFVNNTRWGSKNFSRNERIECSIFINVSAYSSNMFTATLQVASSRPVFNSTYSSPMLNFMDKDFSFRYNESENLFYNPNSFDSNLVAVIAFYANVIIGMDADSFEKNSGTEYYQAAQNLVAMGQQQGYKGWSQQDGNQNRYFLISDILSTTYVSFRETLYDYHLLALDKMSDNQKEGKEKTIAAIKTLSKVHSARPNSFLMRVFFDAKADEVVSIFSGGPAVTVTDLVDTLNRISPLNSTKWSNIK